MSRVIAALNGDSAAEAVLLTAAALGRLFTAQVEAIHVGGERVVLGSAAQEAGVALRTVSGETVETLAHACSGDDVVAIVIGARGELSGRRPVGSTALAVIARQHCPVVVVPPDAPPRPAIRSVLVPLDGTPASAVALAEIVELAHHAALRVVVAHVYSPHALPRFSDHLAHEVPAWSEEFITRYCPAVGPDATLELRVGDPDVHLLEILRESGCDLVALAWRQQLDRGRAAVVRRMLAESPVPVLLTPVSREGELRAGAAEGLRAGATQP